MAQLNLLHRIKLMHEIKLKINLNKWIKIKFKTTEKKKKLTFRK
jgi:hypothetical protein